MTDKENISRIAYLKWANAGKPSGRDVQFWAEAEREFYKNDSWMEPHTSSDTLSSWHTDMAVQQIQQLSLLTMVGVL